MKIAELPEVITCIADGHADNAGKTWCGRPISGFTFADIDHAAMNGRARGRLIACPDCCAAVIESLMNGVISDV